MKKLLFTAIAVVGFGVSGYANQNPERESKLFNQNKEQYRPVILNCSIIAYIVTSLAHEQFQLDNPGQTWSAQTIAYIESLHRSACEQNISLSPN